MSQLTEKDVTVNMQRMYYLLTALDVHQEWLRPYLNKEYSKIVSESKAKNNHLRSIIKKQLTKEEINNIELIGEEILNQIWEEIK
jgi:hypothetical protein